jgi:hypothetical protein
MLDDYLFMIYKHTENMRTCEQGDQMSTSEGRSAAAEIR